MLGVLGLVLSTLTAIAGALVVADVRADVDAARTWQGINAEVTVVGKPPEARTECRFNERYILGPQDEDLRRVVLAHRFVVPLPPPRDLVRCASARADLMAVAELDGARVNTNAPAAISRTAAVALADAVAKPAVAAINRAPRLIASNTDLRDQDSNASGHSTRRLRHVTRTASKTRLVVNAGPRWDWPARGTVASNRVSGSGLAADAIVLAADRSDRDHNQPLPDFTADATTPVQPGCRGPPPGGTQRLTATEPASGRSVVGKRHRPGAESPTAPADLVVIDNFGDRVPVGAAELDVIETYLDGVLCEVLATVASGQDRREL
ncbi:MAG: hypothetical protein NW205_03340 [Hyphomicrobiaceae bacterium]|nr:hypothetical protein [Hyphomicrobiaceae bacterium]